jgi:CHAT domain-containing protein/tetratricopeptide (TPR) repeat protein
VITARSSALCLLALLVACEPKRFERRSPFWIADSLRLEGRSREASVRFAALRDSLNATTDTASLWRATLFLADAQMRLGMPDSAAANFERARVLAGRDSSHIAWTHHQRSLLLHRQGRFAEAMQESELALTMAERQDDYRLQWAALSAHGTILSLQGRYAEAFAYNERSLAIKRDHGAPERDVVNEFNELGIGYSHTGRFSDALRMYEKALAYYRRLRNPEGVARVLANESNVLIALGQLDEARAALSEADSAVKLTGEVRGEALVALTLGDVYDRLGDRVRAREEFVRGAALNRQAKLPYGLVTNLENLGGLALQEGKLDEAGQYLAEALAIADQRNYGRQRAMTRTTLARLAIARREPVEALRWADDAKAIADTLGDPEVQYEALSVRGAALEAARRADAAGPYLEAIDLLESWRGRMALGDLRLGISEPRREVYEGAIRVLVSQGRSEEAFIVADRARARLLLELMTQRDLSPATSMAKDDDPYRRLRLLYEEQTHAPAERQGKVEQEIVALTTALEAKDQSRSDRLLGTASATWRAATPAAVRDSVLHGKRDLLEYFWGDHTVYGWRIDAHGVHSAVLGDADSLAALAAFLRGAAEGQVEGVEWRPSAERAYRVFIAPLTEGAGLPDDIVVVSDGRLAYLPLETFLPGRDSLALGATRRIVYAPSSATLLALAARPAARTWERTALVVGDPNPLGTEAAQAGQERADGSLAPLPFSGEEARSIFQLFASDRADLLVGRRATVRRWLDARPARYRYLHFATHAQVDERAPERTHLVLAGGDIDLPMIRRLDLRAELVTLSACETALGRFVGGEGMIGLPYAFLSAGAEGTVATLWRVTDRSAAAFMRDFYEEVRNGVPPTEALRRVRRTRLERSGAEAHPSRWAPYIFVGTVR